MRALVITVIVLIVVLVGLDFGARFFATSQVEKALASELELATEPDVSVSGFPFLYQAFKGDYGQITIETSTLALGPVDNVNATITLNDVKLPFSEAIAGNADALTAGSADLVARIPSSSLAAAAGQVDLQISAGTNGALRLTTSTEVLGQTVTVSGDAKASISNNNLRLTVSGLTAPVELPAEVKSALAQQLNLSIPLTGLPVAVVSATVTVDGTDVVVTGHAVDVKLADLQTAG